MKVKRPLMTIRLRGPGDLGGNNEHPEDDPLWDNAEVNMLLSRRKPAMEEEKTVRIQAKNADTYKRAKAEMPPLKAQLVESM